MAQLNGVVEKTRTTVDSLLTLSTDHLFSADPTTLYALDVSDSSIIPPPVSSSTDGLSEAQLREFALAQRTKYLQAVLGNNQDTDSIVGAANNTASTTLSIDDGSATLSKCLSIATLDDILVCAVIVHPNFFPLTFFRH